MKFNIQPKEIDKSTYIGGWYLDKSLCEELIDYFNYNKKYQGKGVFGKGSQDDSVKQSIDLTISPGNFDGVIGMYRLALQKILELYVEKFPESGEYVSRFDIKVGYNFQHYVKGGGFKSWHCENNGTSDNYHRHLAFMTYLNDVENGGTEFINYKNIQNDAEQGLTLIWPATWTHTHRGIVSEEKEKFILTGWFSFEEAWNLK